MNGELVQAGKYLLRVKKFDKNRKFVGGGGK